MTATRPSTPQRDPHADLEPRVRQWPVKVLVVSSALPITTDPAEEFLREGIELSIYPDGLGALLGLGENHPAAIIVPTDMRGADLVELLATVNKGTEVPVIVGIGAGPDGPELAFRALECGARSLLALPFRVVDLRGALRQLGVRPGRPQPSGTPLVAGPLTLDPASFRVAFDGQAVACTVREFHILEYLLRHQNRIVPFAELATMPGTPVTANGTKSAVARLRHKLAAVHPDAAAIVETIPRVGYRINANRSAAHVA